MVNEVNAKTPILMYHGTADQVIPFAMGIIIFIVILFLFQYHFVSSIFIFIDVLM